MCVSTHLVEPSDGSANQDVLIQPAVNTVEVIRIRRIKPLERVGSLSHSIDANARIVGPVIIQSGARVEKHATILGPAVIAANACIQSRAAVVHSVIGRGCTVQAHQIVRDRACFGQSASHKGGSSVITPASFSERVARIKMNSQKIAEPAPSRRRVRARRSDIP